MELGMIGLGKMGGNMVLRLLRGGHRVVVFDPSSEAMQHIIKEGATGVASIKELVSRLSKPRAVWVMVPAGETTETAINTFMSSLALNDIVIDGSNSNYKDSMRRAQALSRKGIFFLDVGTSGGIWGLTEGYCLMVGGDPVAYERLLPVFQTLAPAPDKGYGHVGPSGAGHFTKMVHNGIEYGLMEAYAEGFELMQAKREFDLNLAQLAEIWRYGSVIRSWLLDLTSAILKEDQTLSGIQGYVEDSGEGRWTVQESMDLGVPLPVITQALQMRFRSRQEQSFSARLLAAMRNKFGGHAVKQIR